MSGKNDEVDIEKSSPFIDEYFQKHYLEGELSSGGQGVVYRTQDPELLIKLSFSSATTKELVTDKSQKKQLLDKFMRIGFLPMPENIRLAIPVANLTDHAGYVMRFVTDMQEFTDQFIQNGKQNKKTLVDLSTDSDVPEFIKTWFEDEHKVKQGKGFYESLNILHYAKSGGTRRRLMALSECASILARLHSIGIIYVDLSPGNVFISELVEYQHVWMIDADNLRLDGSKGDNYYTPGYGAPEVVKGIAQASQLSDCHAFSVMAFYILTVLKPFNGEKYHNDDEVDWADQDENQNDALTVEEKINRGFFSFVDDCNDDSNRSKNGLPRDLVVTGELKELFQQTLGNGRLSPFQRANIHHFSPALAKAADISVLCPCCNMTYFIDELKQCSYCDSPMPLSISLSSYYGTNIDKPAWQFIHELTTNECEVPQRVIKPFSLQYQSSAALKIQKNQEGITLVAIHENLKIYWAAKTYDSGRFSRLAGQLHLSHEMIAAGTFLYVEDEKYSRLVRLELVGELS